MAKTNTALLVIDMQHFFLPMVTKAIPNISKLCSTFEFLGLPRIFTQHGHTDDELKPPYKNQLVRKWGPDGSIHLGSADWELIPDVAQHVSQPETPVVAKNTYDGEWTSPIWRSLLHRRHLNQSDERSELNADFYLL